MAITTLDGVLAGAKQPVGWFKNNPYSAGTIRGAFGTFWGASGFPGPGLYPNGTAAGGTYSSTGGNVAGMLPHTDPGSGNSYLARLTAFAPNPGGVGTVGAIYLCDRLWDNGGLSATVTTAQTISSVAWPNRDQNGSSNGTGVYVGLEVVAATGNGTPTLTLGYTNDSGTSGRTATATTITGNTTSAGSFFVFGLQGADMGVRSIQTLTLSATWTSGTIILVAFRILAACEIRGGAASGVAATGSLDCIRSCFPQMFNGVVPFLMCTPQGVQPTNFSGSFVETQG